MSLHPRILRVTMGVVGFLAVNTTVEASVVSLKAVKKNNVAITPTNNLAVRGGDKIEAEIFLSGWGNELPEGVRIYQVTLAGRIGFTSGDNSAILPDGWCAPVDKIDCTEPAACPVAYPICTPVWGCTCPGHDPSLGAFISRPRADFLFNGIVDLHCWVNTSSLNYTFLCIPKDRVGVLDLGVPRYVGTLILNVSQNACGTFTIGFVQKIAATFIADPASPPNVVLPISQPLLLTVSECCRIEFPCVPAHCNIDARIAHDRLTGARLNTNMIQMTLCELTADMTPENFEVTVVPDGGIVPGITSVTPSLGSRVTIVLNRRIAQGEWTCVRHIESNRRCCNGSLPGDADNNRVSEPADIFEIFDNLQGGGIPALKIEKCDIDRSLLCTPADLLMVVDLLNDDDMFCDPLPCIPATLPDCPSVYP